MAGICNTIGGMSMAYIGSASASAIYVGSSLAWSAMSTQYTPINYVYSSGQPSTVETNVHPSMDFTARVGIRLDEESVYTDPSKQGYIYYNSGNGYTSLAISGRTKSGVYTPMVEYYGGNKSDDTVRRWRADNANNVPWGDYCKYDYNKEGIWNTSTGEGVNTGEPYVASISNEPIVIDFSTVPIKFIKFWENGRLVFDAAAARRNSDDALGLYDLISGQFLEMPVTPPTPPTPTGETYVSATSVVAAVTANTTPSNSVVNVALPVTADTANMSFRVKGFVPNIDGTVTTGGCIVNKGLVTTSPQCRVRVTPSKPAFHLGTKTLAGSWSHSAGDAFDISCFFDTADASMVIYNNLTELIIDTIAFAGDMSTVTEPLVAMFDCVPISVLQIEKDDVMAFDGISMERDSDGQGGLYDRISNQFFTSSEAVVAYDPQV